jgi:hypothetical protein
MDIYNLNKIFGIKGLFEWNEQEMWEQCEPIESGWNNCKAHSISVSLGMKEMWNTDEGWKRRKEMSFSQRGDNRFAVCGNAGKSHTEETKRKQSLGSKRRMTEEQKKEAVSLYNKGIGIKTIAKQIGFSHTAIRRLVRKQ